MSNLPTRAAVVWTATDPQTTTDHARILVDYCETNHLDIAAFVALPEGLAMLTDGLVDALVVVAGRDLEACGIHVATPRRPTLVRRDVSQTGTPVTQRRPQVLPRDGAR